MNYVKTKIAEKIHVPELVETVRVQSTRQLKVVEEKFPYVHQTLPKHKMTDKQKKKLLKKIERLAKWLDNAVPHSPIPLGVDSILVKRKRSLMLQNTLFNHSPRDLFQLLVVQWEAYAHFIKVSMIYDP